VAKVRRKKIISARIRKTHICVGLTDGTLFPLNFAPTECKRLLHKER